MASWMEKEGPIPPLCCLLFPNDDRFDEIPRFIAHHKERFFDVIHAFKDVGDFPYGDRGDRS